MEQNYQTLHDDVSHFYWFFSTNFEGIRIQTFYIIILLQDFILINVKEKWLIMLNHLENEFGTIRVPLSTFQK